MNNRRLLRAPLLLALPLALIIGACSEDLETGGACPALCPGQQLEILDTVLTPAIVLDTTLGSFPFTGYEPSLLLASRGDTLDVRAVIRFDTLIRAFRPSPTDSIRAVEMVDSASLRFRLRRTGVPLPATFFIDAYDVGDLTLADSAPTNLLPHFTAARLMGSIQIDSAGFKDTTLIKIPIDTAKLRALVVDPLAVMRFGLQIRAATTAEVRIVPSDSALGPILRYRVTPDTTVSVANLLPSSTTPTSPLFVSTDFNDYSIIADAPDISQAGTFQIGGLPGRRSYLKFELPTWLTDSSAVLRARLELVQTPLRGIDDTMPLAIRGRMSLAGHAVTDLQRAANILAPFGVFVGDSLLITPGDSGLVSLEINGLVRQWRTVNGVRLVPNALILSSALEGHSVRGARFFGLGGPAELRPRLRISYVPDTSFSFGRP